MIDAKNGLHVVIVANGELLHPERLLCIVDDADVIIAADGGANWLIAHNRLPDLLIGDMDSISPEALQTLEGKHCHLQRYPRDKDETDTELALLEAISRGATHITIVGALGGRIDHELANVLLLNMPQLDGLETTIFDGTSFLFVIRDTGVIHGKVGDTVSLIPLAGNAEGVVTQGLRYPLHNESLCMGPARGVSNILAKPIAQVSVERGRLLVVHTPSRYWEG